MGGDSTLADVVGTELEGSSKRKEDSSLVWGLVGEVKARAGCLYLQKTQETFSV